jgi:hypothetical protein
MRNQGVMRQTMMVTVLTVAACLSAAATQAADQPANMKTLPPQTDNLGVIASGAVEDNLKTCLARIPKDSSAGQRMIAEQSCERDDEGRQTYRSVPGR